MTTLLEQAIDELRKCSPAEQDTIAALILEEIAALASTPDQPRPGIGRP